MCISKYVLCLAVRRSSTHEENLSLATNVQVKCSASLVLNFSANKMEIIGRLPSEISGGLNEAIPAESFTDCLARNS